MVGFSKVRRVVLPAAPGGSPTTRRWTISYLTRASRLTLTEDGRTLITARVAAQVTQPYLPMGLVQQ